MLYYESAVQCPQEGSLGESLVQVVSEEDGVYLIVLPDGVTPGRREAAEKFAEAVANLRARAPGCSFSFTPFDYESSKESSGVTSWLAVRGRVLPRRLSLMDRMLRVLALPSVRY